jgi:hypothetical protein
VLPSCRRYDTLKKDGNNETLWAEQTAAAAFKSGYSKAEVTGASALDDEPGFSIPADFPPLSNPNFTDVRSEILPRGTFLAGCLSVCVLPAQVKVRWQSYLKTQGLTPSQLGAVSWEAVMPSSAGALVGASLEAKRLYYWSLRYVSWEGSRFLGNLTTQLLAELTPELPVYVNWNNMAAHWFYPGANGTGQLNHDWFEHARTRGGTMLWTEVSQALL